MVGNTLEGSCVCVHFDFLEIFLGKWEPHFLRMILKLMLE